MDLKDKFKRKNKKNKSTEDKKELIKDARIKLSEEELNYVVGGLSNPFECYKGGAYDIEGSGIL